MVLALTRHARLNRFTLNVSTSVRQGHEPCLPKRTTRRKPGTVSTHSGHQYARMTLEQREEYNRWCYQRKLAKKAGAA